jgi:non-canonical purine NTP pyrophosphatase (RdgB/HAM1 family)
MTLYFITGNKEKFFEIKEMIPEVEQLDIDLKEIQSLDSHEIIREKLEEAKKVHSGKFIVEDTSCFFDCLGRLPGPMIKFFLDEIKNEGLYDLCRRYGNYKSEIVTVIGYHDGDKIEYFEGVVKGEISEPKGESNFGYDKIFIPEGYDKNYAELGRDVKNRISARAIAISKLKEYIQKN